MGTAKTTPMTTYQTYLMYSETESTDKQKLIDIKDYPDDAEAEELDITTLSDAAVKSIPGIDLNEKREYTCNYTKGDFDRLKALEGKELYLSEYFGEDGVDGKFNFTGKIKVRRAGKSVNEVREMILAVYPSSQITTA